MEQVHQDNDQVTSDHVSASSRGPESTPGQGGAGHAPGRLEGGMEVCSSYGNNDQRLSESYCHEVSLFYVVSSIIRLLTLCRCFVLSMNSWLT